MTEQETNQSNNLNLSDQAMAFLGLSQQPFSASILQKEAIFLDATLEQLIDTAKHHLQFSELLLIIEGDIGSGKTTLFRKTLQDEVPNILLMPITASATDTLTQIQQNISTHIKDQGDANYLDDNLKRLQTFDQTPVLVIDDAHVLADTTLQELFRYQKQLEAEKEVKLKILMLANKGMAKTIETITDIQHNQLYVQEILPYTEKQIHALLLQRLNAVNYQGKDCLSDDVIQFISKKSNGTPLQIIKQAIIKIEKNIKKQTPSSSKPVKASIIFASLILITLTSMIGYYFLQVDTLLEQDTSIQNNPVTPATTEAGTNLIDDKQANIVNTDRSQAEIEVEEKVSPVIIGDENKETVNNTAITSIENTTNNSESEFSTELESVEIDSKINETVKPEQTEIQKPVDAEPAKPAKPAVELITKTNQPPVIEKEKIAEPEPAPAPAPEPEPEPEPEPKPLNSHLVKLNSLGIHDAEWILQQDAKHWTLQIMGARDPATLVKFSMQHKLNQSSAWFKTELSGKPWYVLIHRLYTDKDIARQSIQRLPPGLKASKPWVKNMGIIQKSIKP